MPSDTATDPVPEPKSPGAPTDNTPVRPYLTIAKLISSLFVSILTIISASLWPLHLHPVFLCTLFTCLTTFTALIYSHMRAPSNHPQGIVGILLLHALPLVLWAVTTALTSWWTHLYHTTTWRSGSSLDAQKTYLAELPPGLTPAKIASDYFRRHRTAGYTAAVRMTGVCAGLAGLSAVLFAVSGGKAFRSVRRHRRACPRELAQGQSLGLLGRGWWAALVSRVRRKETLPVTENEVKVTQADSSVLDSHAGESGSGAALVVGGLVGDRPVSQHDGRGLQNAG